MTVFIEYVIIDNLVIDYLLLKGAFFITAVDYKRLRLILSACFGAGVALAYPLIENGVILTAVKILSGLTMVLIAGKFKSKKIFYICTLIFFFLTFLTGGAIIGVFNLFSIPLSNEYSIAFMILPVYFLIKWITAVIKFIYQRRHVISLTYKTVLFKGDMAIETKGFMDTGNGLFDGQNPVVMVSKDVFFALLGKNALKTKLKKISVQTVTGEKQSLAVELDQLLLYYLDKPHIYNNVTACLINRAIGGDYDVILHPAFMEMNYENQPKIKTEKIS